MKIFENLWKSLKISYKSEPLWKSLQISENLWKSLEIPEHLSWEKGRRAKKRGGGGGRGWYISGLWGGYWRVSWRLWRSRDWTLHLEPPHLNSQISSLTKLKKLKSQISNPSSSTSNLKPQVFSPELSNLKKLDFALQTSSSQFWNLKPHKA